MSYIEKESLLKDVKAIQGDDAFGIPRIVAAIENAPIIDAIKVVRCSQCEYGKGGYHEGERYCTWFACDVGADNYCKYAERKKTRNVREVKLNDKHI